MMNNRPLSFLIRDALAHDIEQCLALDLTYESEYVWQMTIRQNSNGWDINFRTERLPRSVEHTYEIETARFDEALKDDQTGFMVAEDKQDQSIFAYLIITHDRLLNSVIIRDIVVSRPFRRSNVGGRLLNVAYSWAQDLNARQMMIPVQTKNFSGIQFCLNNGFIFCGFNDHYYPNRDIAVFFNKSLR